MQVNRKHMNTLLGLSEVNTMHFILRIKKEKMKRTNLFTDADDTFRCVAGDQCENFVYSLCKMRLDNQKWKRMNKTDIKVDLKCSTRERERERR